MDLNELRSLKNEYERKILQLVSEFTKKTNIIVKDIEYSYVKEISNYEFCLPQRINLQVEI